MFNLKASEKRLEDIGYSALDRIGSMPRRVQAGMLLKSDLANLTKAIKYLDGLMDGLNLNSDYRSVRAAHQRQFDNFSNQKSALKQKLEKAFSKKEWGGSPHNFLISVFQAGMDATEAAREAGLTIDEK